ncbi:MAG: hypothetical protein ACKVU4_15070 [Phycisphaerales bacterium]
MQTLRAMVILVTVLAAAAPARQPETAPSQPPPVRPAPVHKVWHLKVSGDLDSDELVRGFAAELARAADANAGMILIELDGNRSRPDVVRAMARLVAESPVRVAAYLSDPRDKTVGVGQAIVGLLGSSCLIAPETRLRTLPGDDLRSLAPEDTEWEPIEQDLADALRTAIEPRGADAQIAELLVRPTIRAWFVRSPEPAHIENTPTPGATQFVFMGARGLERIEVAADLAVDLKLVGGPAPSLTRALSSLGAVSGASRQRSEVTSGLAAAEKTLVHAVDDLRVAVERIEETLRISYTKLDRRPQTHDYRRAGEEALRHIEDTEQSLAAALKLTGQYPELLRDRSATPTSGRGRVLGNFRVRLDEHRASAEEYRTRR